MESILEKFYKDWLRVDASTAGIGVTFIQVRTGNGDILDCYHSGKEWSVKLRRAGQEARRMYSAPDLYEAVRNVLGDEYGT